MVVRRVRSDQQTDWSSVARLLDPYLPAADVVEQHSIRVDAPAELTYRLACNLNLEDCWPVRAIFRARELLLGAHPDHRPDDRRLPAGLVPMTKSLGWGELAQAPGRFIVMGAVTQPWLADVVFRAIPPEQFAAFAEPGFVKIVWTLAVEPVPFEPRCIFRTETRARATDEAARRQFRSYWRRVSPGIWLIRWFTVRLLRRQAEQAVRLAKQA